MQTVLSKLRHSQENMDNVEHVSKAVNVQQTNLFLFDSEILLP
jgi:hypothetical protein